MPPTRNHGHTEYQRERIGNRSRLRYFIRDSLRLVSGQPQARMSWKRYYEDVVVKRKVEIVGWPRDIPFADPSDVSLGRKRLLPLIKSWEEGRTRFVKLSPEDLAARMAERDVMVAAGLIAPPKPRALRADFGDRRPHVQKGPAGKHQKKFFYSKSARFVQDGDDEFEDEDFNGSQDPAGGQDMKIYSALAKRAEKKLPSAARWPHGPFLSAETQTVPSSVATVVVSYFVHNTALHLIVDKQRALTQQP
ncbi:hypothetical protein EVG20_g7098 [Dentipellis fragilis]|uniref:Uncharacterized protein n=1 Tax=Dentipellis fragilis TaxID=205917 RepID=A0A4Y9YIR2_9AGAM|nr:hypothetical protein EVG20_g7098 [Dentipellis fragilis]